MNQRTRQYDRCQWPLGPLGAVLLLWVAREVGRQLLGPPTGTP